ncbi:YdcF family protein [Clostridium lacusfryxellense]|uniref:YdcF family protein n=1 Tax=Clostridium lacusfryxellense TaxID=205328 RepID=UPI001C0AB267|nr:YdcF family protein [Clostridium lacusfryxellense]MBU3112920.1 YdcF family protein [Clostridium lacusfryxellense]
MRKHVKMHVFLCVLSVMGLYNLISKKDFIFIIPEAIRMLMEICFFISLVSFILVEILIVKSGRVKHTQESDYLVVLGAGLRGKSPSIPLLQRLNASLEYVKINPDIKIVVSGGRGIDESITEAEAMKRFLIKRGVAVDQIIKEERSTSTLENLKFTTEILKELDKKENINVTIVTNNFHMFRSKFLAKRQGLKAYGYPAPLNRMLVVSCFVREYFAVINSFIFDR